MAKEHMGDGVYVDVLEMYPGQNGVVLTTEDGISTTNRIVLEPEVWGNLLVWVQAQNRRVG